MGLAYNLIFGTDIDAINAQLRRIRANILRLRDSVLLSTSHRCEMFIGIIGNPMPIFLAPFPGHDSGPEQTAMSTLRDEVSTR